MLQQQTHKINDQIRNLPVAPSPPVCAIEIGSRYTTLTSGMRMDNRISTSHEYSAGVELGGDIMHNEKVISNATLAKLEHVLSQMRKYCAEKGIGDIPGVASATVSRATNSADIQVLAGKYNFEIELISRQRECELDYHTATHGLPKRLVCTLRSHSCNTAWLPDSGTAWLTEGEIETNYVEAGYEEAFERFIHNTSSIKEACETYGLHLKNHLYFLPIAMDQLIVTAALPCARYISGLKNKTTGGTILPRTTVTRKLRELQCISKPEFDYLKKHTDNISELLSGLIFMNYLLHRTDMAQLLVTDSSLSTAQIHQYFDNSDGASA
ncbi:MAG: hypothetical protein ABFS24_10310 [Pseudomonadota bacterium]